jgi:NADPH:quinone reductase-like Zn-dependent oxidoreductase
VIVYGNNKGTSPHTGTAATPNDPDTDNESSNLITVSWQQTNIPTATKGHVLVKVVCAGLNPVDAKNVIGDKLPHSWTYFKQLYYNKLLAGNIIGFDFSGNVQGCPDNGSFQKGDEVFGTMPPFHGTLAEYIVAPLHQVHYKSNKHSFAQAAALPLVGLTALQALSPHIQSSKGQDSATSSSSSSSTSVLIIGASGGAGHVACQVARNLGAQHVTAICSSRNAEFCKGRGATHVVDYHNPSAELIETLKAAPGCPFDVVMDCVTSADPRDSSIHHYPSLLQAPGNGLVNEKYVYLRLGGATWDWFRAGVRRSTYGMLNLFWGSEQLFWVRFPHSSSELKQLVQWADEGKLTPNLHNVYDFTPEAVQNAFDAMLSRRVQGKVIVQVNNNNDDNK